ncbi:MAG TPA: AAA family ATPase [Candidatus Saccharimonadales bacterium]|nr:AAA family ATPase [Candidatus Saccharimonadales bacterium]
MNSSKPIILTFVGMTGAGKDMCTDYVAHHYSAPVIHFGHMVYDEIARRGLNIVKDEKMVREDMRAKEGLAVLAKRVAAKAHDLITAGHKRIALNGLYSWSEYKYLSQEFGEQFICVAITAPRSLRYKRLLNRKDAHRQYTLKQIIDREVAEIENLEKGGPIARADYTLLNDSSPEDLHKKIAALLQEMQF